MFKIIPYIVFLCLTSFTATSGLPVIARGCDIQMNKKTAIKCTENDTECQTKNVENSELNKTVRS